MDKACIFVDGENLRHVIVELFPPPKFRQEDYLPNTADWRAFFDWIASQVGACHRVRTYWYMVEWIDFYPSSITKATNPYILKKLFSANKAFRARMDKKVGAILQTELEVIVDELQAERDKMKKRFDGWREVQDGIAYRHDAIEFRRAGSIRYDLIRREFGTEKAVDVKLATDMIMLRDIYDVAIIVSGDQDFVPAVQVVKDSGKRVVNVSFLKSSSKQLPGGAKRLERQTDSSIRLKYAEVGQHLGLLKPTPVKTSTPASAAPAAPSTAAGSIAAPT